MKKEEMTGGGADSKTGAGKGKTGKKIADIDDVLATFSAHIKENYPSPEQFRENLRSLLEAKQERLEESDYAASLEKNIIFLHDLAIEGEALLEIVLGTINEPSSLDAGAGPLLDEMEKEVRATTPERHRSVFVEGGSGEFSQLLQLRAEGGKRYMEKLEFDYFYLMTLRMLLFEFFNVLETISREYHIDRIDPAAPSHVTGHIEMTANYYLGNISVGEIVEDEKDGETEGDVPSP